jgi:hypothetical protein
MRSQNKKNRIVKTYFETNNLNGFVPSPDIDDQNKSFKYQGVEVFNTLNKGLGIRVTQNLSPGFMIPFGGHFRNDKTCIENALKNSGKNNHTRYLVESLFDKDGKAVAWLDAHERLYNIGVPKNKYAWIGSLVNEPGMGEKCNSELVWIRGSRRPKYPHMCNNMNVFLKVIMTIQCGEEILVDYRYSKTSYKKLGYLPVKFQNAKVVDYNTTTRKKRKLDYGSLNLNGSICFK